MLRFGILTALVAALALQACSSPQKRAAKAQQRSHEAKEKSIKQDIQIKERRLKLAKQYEDCKKAEASNASTTGSSSTSAAGGSGDASSTAGQGDGEKKAASNASTTGRSAGTSKCDGILKLIKALK